MPSTKQSVGLPDKFYLVSADLSLRRPGFAKLVYDNGTISQVETMFVDNKTARKTHGQLLNEITDAMVRFFPANCTDFPPIFVRERALDMYAQSHVQAKTIEALSKVVGISDAFLWRIYRREFEEIHPKTVKKNLTGNATAEKEEVAKALEPYVGHREYVVDDESDALAVGIAWLLERKAFPEKKA